MKILLIDNNTIHLSNLRRALASHEVEVQKYRLGMDFNDHGKDLVILSGGGGEGREAADVTRERILWYQTEMDYILNSKKPILGICMGFELIAQAYGSRVEKLPKLITGYHPVKLANSAGELSQFESHRWVVRDISGKHFEVLAESETGLEIIKHKNKSIFATQFHPEVNGSSVGLQQIIDSPGLLKI